ncbi:hypothetical protein [Aquimarina rubra]|uniref:STAS/SEC14 domain-containing protein n=1 Tax=Aquimarina rubra TaxID=1920033 RepID=A0ABW5LLW2_9FLAO
MPENLNKNLINKYDLTIGSFYFYNNFMVSEVKKGVTFSVENSSELFKLIEKHFNKNTPFFYIANRKNSYSFNPTGHYEFIELFPNAKAFAVIAYDQLSIRIAKFEQSFIKAPTGIFDNLEDAIIWGKEKIRSH